MNGQLFQGARVRLTALTKDDLPAITRFYQDSTFARLFDATPAYPREAAHWEKWFEDEQKEDNAYMFAIRTGETFLGWLKLESILWAHRVAWLSIAIGDPAQRGKGYGHEALTLLLTFAFDELNLHRVQLTVFAYNERAIRLYERLGFVREGTFRQFLQRDGERHDMLLYGLLRDEFVRGG